MKIIYEDNHLLVVNKPPNIPVCKDISNDLDLLNILKQYLKEKYNKKGNVYLGLVHRLDRPTSGVMVFAKTSKAASRLCEQIRKKEFYKEYYAVVKGKINTGHYHDYISKEKNNISKIDSNGKEAILDYELIKYDKESNLSLVKIILKTGRSHQIRVQFSHHHHPLYGDTKYDNTKGNLALLAKKIAFFHPTTKEKMTFEVELPNKYPFNKFKK